MARDYYSEAYSEDDVYTLAYLREVAPERLDAARDALEAETKPFREAAAWDEAGHAIAAALCGVQLVPFVFTLLPGVSARERTFIWWAGPYARRRSKYPDPFTYAGDLGAADGDFHRFETEEEMARQLDLAWPHVRALAKHLIDRTVEMIDRSA